MAMPIFKLAQQKNLPTCMQSSTLTTLGLIIFLKTFRGSVSGYRSVANLERKLNTHTPSL